MYNVAKSPDPDGIFQMDNPLVVPKGCAILASMKQIEAETIQYIKNLSQSNDLMDFDNKFGHSEGTKVSDILWLCSSMLSSSSKHFRVSQIMWFTDEDQPHVNGSSDFLQAFQKAKDLQQLRLDIQFYPLKPEFKPELFYNELFCQLLNEDPDDFQLPMVQINDTILRHRLFRRGFKNRSISHLLVEISDKAKFGVGIYCFTRKATVPKPVTLSRDTNEQIVAKRSYKFGKIQEDASGDDGNLEFEFDYSEKLEASQTIKFQYCGGERINFTPLEAYEIKQVMEPKIKILGFKPRNILSVHNHIKSPYFIYPNESRVKNSSVLFRTLWEQLLKDDKVAICLFVMKLKSYPRVVALVPQEQTTGKDGETLRYDGFRLEFIPFAEDVRDLSETLTDAPEVDEDVVKAMSGVLSRLRINYSPAVFSNPVVSRIYNKIEEQVFNEDNTTANQDNTMPNLEAQDQRICEYVNQLEQLVGFDEEVVAKKRKATDENGDAVEKKKPLLDIDMDEVLARVKENPKSVTIPILKAYLEVKKVKGLSKLNKTQCIAKILELEN